VQETYNSICIIQIIDENIATLVRIR